MNGDRYSEFDALVARHQRMIRAICLWHATGGAVECDDLVQEVLLSLWRSRHKLRPGSSAGEERAWVRYHCRSVISHFARRKSLPTVALDESLNIASTPADDNSETLQALAADLTDHEREVLRMTLEGYEADEIADTPSSGIIRGGAPNDIMTVEWSHPNREKGEYSGGVEIDNTKRRSVSYRDLRRSDDGIIYASLAQAREGQTVVIQCKPRKVKADPTLPDTVRMQNTDMEYVVYWTRLMVRRGYTVSISYDNDTAVYHCIAVRTQKKKKNNKN